MPPPLDHGAIDKPAAGKRSRREFVRARWDGSEIAVGDGHDSGALASLAVCNVLIDRAPDSPALPAGAFVRGYVLESSGIA